MRKTLRFLSSVRRAAPWLLLIAALAAYPLLRQTAITLATAGTSPADAASSEAQVSAQWLDLSGPSSKMVIAVIAFCLGLGLCWFVLGLIMRIVADWARGKHCDDPSTAATDFKTEFLALPSKWRFVIFFAAWGLLLLFFALCWLGASLVQ